MQVLKFGGSSVANADNINKVAEIIGQAVKNDRTVVLNRLVFNLLPDSIRLSSNMGLLLLQTLTKP